MLVVLAELVEAIEELLPEEELPELSELPVLSVEPPVDEICPPEE